MVYLLSEGYIFFSSNVVFFYLFYNAPVETKIKKSRQQTYEFGDGDDDYILHLEDILRRIHAVFYETMDSIRSKSAEEAKNIPSIVKYCSPGTPTPDTKVIVTELRRDVLRGANIVFTGVIPTSARQEDSQPWRIACGLGAKVSNGIVTPKDTKCNSEVTTHVIAGRLGTEKSYRAVKSRGIKLVNPGWLFCCHERWEWVDERLFPVEGLEKYRQQIRDQGTPRGTPHGTPGLNLEPAAVENAWDMDVVDKEGVITKSRSDSASSADILMSTLNPLLSFSPSEVEAMDKEVEDLMNASDEESDLIGSVSDSSSSSDSGSTSKRKREGEQDSREDENNEWLGKKRKIDDDKCEKKDEDDEEEDDEEEQDSSSSDSDDYTHRSSPSDDDDDMAAMLDAELSHS